MICHPHPGYGTIRGEQPFSRCVQFSSQGLEGRAIVTQRDALVTRCLVSLIVWTGERVLPVRSKSQPERCQPPV